MRKTFKRFQEFIFCDVIHLKNELCLIWPNLPVVRTRVLWDWSGFVYVLVSRRHGRPTQNTRTEMLALWIYDRWIAIHRVVSYRKFSKENSSGQMATAENIAHLQCLLVIPSKSIRVIPLMKPHARRRADDRVVRKAPEWRWTILSSVEHLFLGDRRLT
jgi:hypothetical protein